MPRQLLVSQKSPMQKAIAQGFVPRGTSPCDSMRYDLLPGRSGLGALQNLRCRDIVQRARNDDARALRPVCCEGFLEAEAC
eukprot:1073591-Pyramimonas_sp.AAC.1